MRRTVEQRNLMWGSEVTTFLPGRPGRAARVVRVDDQHIGFATALALVLTHGQARGGHDAEACCPRCGRRGPTERDFGTRLLNGKRRPQSWCRGCRAGGPPAFSPADVPPPDRHTEQLPLLSRASETNGEAAQRRRLCPAR
jgi:hypothetical protein